MYDIVDYIFFTIMGLLSMVAALIIFVMVPISLSAQADCLEAGYPESRVTWNLKRYCMNLDGSVTVAVHQINAD